MLCPHSGSRGGKERGGGRGEKREGRRRACIWSSAGHQMTFTLFPCSLSLRFQSTRWYHLCSTCLFFPQLNVPENSLTDTWLCFLCYSIIHQVDKTNYYSQDFVLKPNKIYSPNYWLKITIDGPCIVYS